MDQLPVEIKTDEIQSYTHYLFFKFTSPILLFTV